MIQINEYEKAIMFNTKLMKIFYVILFLINIFIPLKSSGSGYVFSISVFNLIALVILFYATLNGLGYFKQNIPFLWLGVVRICQGIYNFLFHSETFNWYSFIVLVVFDVLFIFFLFMDRKNYTYVEEEEEEEEEN